MTQLAYGGGVHGYTREYCERAFFGESIGQVEPAAQFTDDNVDWGSDEALTYEREMEPNPGWRWHNADADRVTGRVWGGCLEIVSMQLMADRYLPAPGRLEGAVLFFETSELLREAHYVEEVLMSMGERGLLERFGAVVVGRAKARNLAEDRPPEERREHRERQRAAVREQVDRYNPNAPVLFDFDFGHTDPIVPVPIGTAVTVDPGTERVEFH